MTKEVNMNTEVDIDALEEHLCVECKEPVDPEGNDDSRWSSVKEDYVCYSCYESDTQSCSTIHLIEGDLVVKIYVGDLDIFNEYGDPVDGSLRIRREWVSSDTWRGYHNTIIAGWVDVLSGWTTGGWGDPVADRKANFNEWAEALLTQEIYPPCSVAIVTDPTSNLFSTAITVLVKERDVKSFREWLSDEYDDLNSSLS